MCFSRQCVVYVKSSCEVPVDLFYVGFYRQLFHCLPYFLQQIIIQLVSVHHDACHF